MKLDDIVKLYKELSKINQKTIIVHSESVNWLNYLIIIMFLALMIVTSEIMIKGKVTKKEKISKPELLNNPSVLFTNLKGEEL